MRTLVISDLHIGQPGGTSVLERPGPIEILIETLAQYERLVLLGDAIELLEGSWAQSYKPAKAIMGRIAAAVPKIVYVPGNHDHLLISEWVQAQGAGLAREALVPHDASPELEEFVSWLAGDGAQVEVRYPGVWLTDTVWATHGHYLNHFLKPVSSVGLHGRKHRVQPPPPVTPAQLESVIAAGKRPHMSEGFPPQRWHDRLVPAAFATAVSWALDIQVRRHAVPAFGQAVAALGVDSQYAIFGHVHRLGPMPLDNAVEWRGAGGRVGAGPQAGMQLLNTGSWRFEPIVANGADPLHPYWPGGAVRIREDGIPEPLNLLQQLSEVDLR